MIEKHDSIPIGSAEVSRIRAANFRGLVSLGDCFEGKYWVIGLVGFIWLVFVPFNDYIMGMISAYCWRNQKWIRLRHEEEGYFLLMWFWLIGFVPLLILAFTMIGVFVPLLHGAYFNKGRKRGELFVRADEFSQMLGRSSEWSKNALIQMEV